MVPLDGGGVVDVVPLNRRGVVEGGVVLAGRGVVQGGEGRRRVLERWVAGRVDELRGGLRAGTLSNTSELVWGTVYRLQLRNYRVGE